MLRGGILHRGPWKWPQARGRKRKRGGGQGEGNGGGGQGDGGQGEENGGGGQGEGNGGGGQGEGNGGGGQGGGGQGEGNGGGGQGEGNGGGGQGEGNGGGGQGGEILDDVPRPIIWGRRSHLDGINWICEHCGRMNYPSRELFVDLPAFRCSRCHAQRRENFRFSFGNLATNEKCPIGEVLNQGERDECLLFTLTKGAEITSRICEILSGSNLIVPTMEPSSLKDAYKLSRLAEGVPECKINYLDDAALARMLELLQTVGVHDINNQYTSRIGGVEQVEGYFEDIARELAKDYPLFVEIMTGDEFGNLKYHQVYQSPFNNRTIKEGSTVMMHTVLLVGAARSGDYDYFYFLNSYGMMWCVRFDETRTKKIGGIGKLVADDICCQPYKFLRIVQQ